MFPPIYNDKALNAMMMLMAHKSKKSVLFDYMKIHANKRTELGVLRKNLSKINDSMAEEVIRNREDRS